MYIHSFVDHTFVLTHEDELVNLLTALATKKKRFVPAVSMLTSFFYFCFFL